MKKLYLILFLFASLKTFSQTQNICASVDCKRSVRMSPTDSISLNSLITASSPTTTIWRVVTGTATLTNPTSQKAYAKGLIIGTNIFQLTAQTASATATAMDTVIAYAPCPVTDSAGIIAAYVKAHPCPVCKVYTAADTAAIQALKVCPTCPICPIIPPQRVATGITWDIILNKKVVTYNDGSTSSL